MLYGLLSVFFVKFAPVTVPTYRRSFSTPQMSWNYRSRRRKPLLGPDSTSSSIALKSPTFSGILSLSQGGYHLQCEILNLFILFVSAPEEDYISVHIRVVGDFTTALSKAVGCDFKSKEKSKLAPLDLESSLTLYQ